MSSNLVILHVCFKSKEVSTHSALKWFFACVYFEVLFHVAGLVKDLLAAANLTLVVDVQMACIIFVHFKSSKPSAWNIPKRYIHFGLSVALSIRRLFWLSFL